MPGGLHDDTTYPGFSWHVVGDPERLGAARQALATKKHARQTAIKWDDEAVRETDDGGYIVWKEPVTPKGAHSWFMRVFEGLERATGGKKSKPGLTGTSANGRQRPSTTAIIDHSHMGSFALYVGPLAGIPSLSCSHHGYRGRL